MKKLQFKMNKGAAFGAALGLIGLAQIVVNGLSQKHDRAMFKSEIKAEVVKEVLDAMKKN